jgi:alcohol dehydrogenase class IV
MSGFSFNTARFIRNEPGGAKRLGEIAREYLSFGGKISRVMLITDPGLMALGLPLNAMDSLTEAGFDIALFQDVEADPSVAVIKAAVGMAKEHKADLVIGFGGGSSMDVAKLVSLLAISEQQLDDIYGVGMVTGNRLPLALIPTTAGTGSEVTAISIVTTGESEKKGVVSPVLYPDLALLDAELAMGLPPHITAATGVDAMVHAIEAYTSKSVNNNPMSKMLARQALQLLGDNICKVTLETGSLQARSDMLLGSMLAGQAFANSPVAAVHALAYPIGGQFHVAHGLSNSLILPAVMAFNATSCAEQYAELAPLVFADHNFSGPTQAICAAFIDQMAALTQKLGLATTLREVGIGSGDLESLSTDAMRQTRLLVNNPREVTYDDAFKIYEQTL